MNFGGLKSMFVTGIVEVGVDIVYVSFQEGRMLHATYLKICVFSTFLTLFSLFSYVTKKHVFYLLVSL